MSAVTLFELKGQWLDLANRLADMDLDADTIADTLEGSDEQMALEEKVQGYEMVARNIEMPITAIEAEIKRLQELKATYQKRADVLRERVLTSMQELGIKKITCPLFEISLRKNPSKVVVYDESMVPFNFWRKPEVEIAVDKKLLKAALDAGEEVHGARLEQTERLNIR
jgi:hypothetical protein